MKRNSNCGIEYSRTQICSVKNGFPVCIAMRSIDVGLHINEEKYMNKTDESHIETDSKMGLIINAGYERGFTTAIYRSPEIASKANIEDAIVAPMT